MDSSMIGKIQKAKQYAAEPERINFETFKVTLRGEHDTHVISYDHDTGWQCDCHYFSVRGLCSHTMALERLLGVMVERAQAKQAEEA